MTTRKAIRRKTPALRRIRSRADHYAAAFERDYLRSQYCFVEFLVEHWSDVSRTFGGDLQLALVLAVIGQRELRAAIAGETTPRAQSTGQFPPRFMAAARIADATGIPRETVRRKLKTLSERQWVEHVPGAGWGLRLTGPESKAATDLRDIDARARRRLAALVADLEKLA